MRRLHEHFVDGDEVSLGEALEDLQQLTERLRRDCPWDREQTERTIVPHTVEEAYEVADAAIARDDAKLADELGDLLFHVYFPSLLLAERGGPGLEDVARSIHDKLVRRHPHVFGDAEARTAGRVRERWEQIKTEQEGRSGIFHHVPEALPAPLYARTAQQRAAAVNFEYAHARSSTRAETRRSKWTSGSTRARSDVRRCRRARRPACTRRSSCATVARRSAARPSRARSRTRTVTSRTQCAGWMPPTRRRSTGG